MVVNAAQVGVGEWVCQHRQTSAATHVMKTAQQVSTVVCCQHQKVLSRTTSPPLSGCLAVQTPTRSTCLNQIVLQCVFHPATTLMLCHYKLVQPAVSVQRLPHESDTLGCVDAQAAPTCCGPARHDSDSTHTPKQNSTGELHRRRVKSPGCQG